MSEVSASAHVADVLAWYDRHRRHLPWRAPPGRAADPYRVWLSEIMLQQTTVKAVGPYYARFLDRFPTIRDLAQAEPPDVLQLLAGLGYYARRATCMAAPRRWSNATADDFRKRSGATELPGIGDYTAAAIAAIAFDQPATPVDGNIERVIARLHAVEQELPGAKPLIRQLAAALTPQRRAGDFAQALMDLGSTICTPKQPACALCPWTNACRARARGDADTFPRKTPKIAGKLRRGAAFVVLRANGQLLVRTRATRGLLGGMTEVPNSAWTHDFDEDTALDHAPQLRSKPNWRRIQGVVRHVFTHFPLELVVYRASVPSKTAAPAGTRWIPMAGLAAEALPNLMRKVIAHADVESVGWTKARSAVPT